MSAAESLHVPVKDVSGGDKGQIEVPLSRLDSRVRYPLIKEAVVMFEANRRVGTADTKTRGQLAGSNKKPWRQKGTGRARAGSRKSPLWRGGGTIFGPHPRDYSYSINRKQRRLALRSALFSKVRDGQVVVLEGLSASGPKTKPVAQALKALHVRGCCLIGTKDLDKNLVLAARNLPGVFVSPLREFNALDVMKARTILLTREALDSFLSDGLPGDEPSKEAVEA